MTFRVKLSYIINYLVKQADTCFQINWSKYKVRGVFGHHQRRVSTSKNVEPLKIEDNLKNENDPKRKTTLEIKMNQK